MTDIITQANEENVQQGKLAAHAARFFHHKQAGVAASQEQSVTPFGLKHSKEMSLNPRKHDSFTATATQTPTPRGDSNGDVGMDVDF